MKKLLSLLGFLTFGLTMAADAQVIPIDNTNPSGCLVYFQVRYTDAAGDTYGFDDKVLSGSTMCYEPAGGTCSGLPGVAPFTYEVIRMIDAQGMCPFGTPTGSCPNPDMMTIGTTTTPFPQTDCYESTTLCVLCTPGSVVTADWIDIPGGDVNVNIY